MNAENRQPLRQAITDETAAILGNDLRVASMLTSNRHHRDRRNEQAVRNLSVMVMENRTMSTSALKRRWTLLVIPALAACAALLVMLPTFNTGTMDSHAIAPRATMVQPLASGTTQPSSEIVALTESKEHVAGKGILRKRNTTLTDILDATETEAMLADLASEHLVDQLTNDLHHADDIVLITNNDIDNLLKGI